MKHFKKAFLIAPAFLVLAASFAAIVMLLWNWLIPAIFRLPTISYWQALGLFILARLLFGSFWKAHHHSDYHHNHFDHRNHLREKWLKMTEEERDEFINRRMNHFHHHFGKRDFYGRSYCRPNTHEATGEDSSQQ